MTWKILTYSYILEFKWGRRSRWCLNTVIILFLLKPCQTHMTVTFRCCNTCGGDVHWNEWASFFPCLCLSADRSATTVWLELQTLNEDEAVLSWENLGVFLYLIQQRNLLKPADEMIVSIFSLSERQIHSPAVMCIFSLFILSVCPHEFISVNLLIGSGFTSSIASFRQRVHTLDCFPFLIC